MSDIYDPAIDEMRDELQERFDNGKGAGPADVEPLVSEIDRLRTELAEHKELRENVEYILDKEDGAVSVREGGGPESLSASLAVTWAKKNEVLADKERQLQESWSVRRDLDDLAERDEQEQEPVGEVTKEPTHRWVSVDRQGCNGELKKGDKLYRHPPAPAAVPLAHADLYEAIHEACATMPEPVSDDDGDTQADHIYSAVRPFVADAEPASRSESEIKAEALEGVAEDIAATIGESRWGAIGVQGLRNRAARLRGEGSE